MVHDPAWPDKVMSAAILVQIGGLFAIAFVVLRAVDATIDVSNAPLLTEWPDAIMLGAGAVGIVAGVYAYIHQAWSLVVLGVLADVASLGFLGISVGIGLAAAVPLVLSFLEGEETRLDRRRVHRSAWPDKAIMASTLLYAGAAVCLAHGVLALANWFDGPGGAATGRWWGAALLAVAIFVFVAARQAFWLRRVWSAWVAVVLLVASGAFYVVGPVFGIATAVFLWLAEREQEFVDGQPAAS